MFQIVCSDLLHQQVAMAVHYHAFQRRIFLLSQPHSSRARQAVIKEEPFTFTIQIVVNVFFMKYVAMIVAQHYQALRMASLLTMLCMMPPRPRIMPIIHQSHAV
jgi:hypothetical protein